MEKVDRPLISIFHSDESGPEIMQSMRDIASLSGILSELGSHASFHVPGQILRFLRVIQLLNEEALGLDDPIENAETVYYRYRNRYKDPEPPSKKSVEQVINILVKYNWISKQSRQLKMRDLGKRMMDALIRLANDSLAYYMRDDIGRSLFQAKRDAEISEAYDDHGISGGNKIASMIRNVENAIQLMKERELEMLADRNALPQLELIHQLMEELDQKLQERLRQFETLEDSIVLANLMQNGTAVLAEGTNLSLGMINKYLKFTHMQKTPLTSSIQPEKVREFIIQMFDPPLESDVPNVYQMLSFMEQNQYEEEAVDGMWFPVKFAAPLSAAAIEEAVSYLETYEPYVEPLVDDEEELIFLAEEISIQEMEALLGDSKWMLTKAMIETEQIESYMNKHEEALIEQVVIEATTDQWSDAVNALTAISALVGNKKMTITKTEETGLREYERKWEWMNHEDRANIIRKRSKS
ncbi:hypothetical protein P9761_12795 [Brevibacillus centrosporus]|uniref:hypothetical protein n=1 Tax=Brevibacillus centrosporus TaxID=54910 RepID=UPI000F09EC94|nr:hypothetical protein [Brevibacillus centrosporus]MEC2130226.1 hypothetical protein [Brevibacillus centrosporus]MED4909097.1 hypothetical protein [Brevibacillus centrosporus]RNB70943.1 hypothetical protein EDM55_09150 [Brevibacillus centrosporus]GED30255.1 hypothetical protein BCE02nite_13960 [Brevibacillus centrosporus]